MSGWDRSADVVVVGAGAGGLAGALSAAGHGLEPIVLNGASLVGGSSALAGGGIWVPKNRFMAQAGIHDSAEEALRYMDDLVGDEGPATSMARKRAFVLTAPQMLAFLEQQGLRFRPVFGYPDYHPDYAGASVEGRGVESELFDMRLLGPWADRFPRKVFPRTLPMSTGDVQHLFLARRTVRGAATYGRLLARHAVAKARGEQLAAGGAALVAQLLHAVLGNGIEVRHETPAVELVVEDGRVAGVVADHGGQPMRLEARRGVLLAAGGFARNDAMRQRYHPHPTGVEWTSASTSDQGDGIRLGMAAGAATALMDDCWWGPSSKIPGGPAIFHVSERSKPGSIIVDRSGRRYMDEAISYVDAVHAMYERDRDVPAVPSWLIFDTTHRRRYPFGTMLPWITPKELLENGYLKRDATLAGLARRCGIDPEGLEATVERFNAGARDGLDPEFGRGTNAYDAYYGDPKVKPNPCLAPLDRGPFYAVELFPGDLGTKGGLVTDEDGRVLREDGSAIDGLYGAGNTTASVMGHRYPGPGVTLASAMTFAYRAMRAAAGVA